MHARLAILMSTLLIAFGVLQAAPSASMIVVTVAVLVAARYAAFSIGGSEFVARGAAQVRRQSQREVASPQHPHTPGRRRSRAPSMRVLAAL
jgi:hypothetical protein